MSESASTFFLASVFAIAIESLVGGGFTGQANQDNERLAAALARCSGNF